jgi:hypothetical protein
MVRICARWCVTDIAALYACTETGNTGKWVIAAQKAPCSRPDISGVYLHEPARARGRQRHMGLVVSSYRIVLLPPHQLVVLGRTRTPGRHGPAPAKASGFRLPLSCRPPSPPLVCRAVLVALVGWPASTPAPIKKKSPKWAPVVGFLESQ